MKSSVAIILCLLSSLIVRAQLDIEYYNKGEILRYDGDYKGAEQEYLKAIKLNPILFDAIIELAIIEYEVNQNFENALNYLEYCIQNTKDSDVLMRVYLHKGIIYSILNDDKSSLKMFNKGIDINGSGENKALLYGARGYEVYYFNNELNKALADFEKSIKIYPTYEAYKAQGELFYSIENYEEAEKDFTTALQLEPNNTLILYFRGKTRNWLNKYELSLRDLESVNLKELAINSEKYISDYYYYRGEVKYYLERYEEAITDLEKSISITDTVADVFYRLGRTYLKLEKFKEAISSFNNSLKYEPDDEFALKDIGISYLELGKYQDAKNYLEKSMHIDDSNFAVHQALGQYYIIENNYEQAIQELNTSIELVRSKELTPDGEPEYYRAITYFGLSKKEEACLDLEKALEFGFDKDKIEKLKEKYCK